MRTTMALHLINNVSNATDFTSTDYVVTSSMFDDDIILFASNKNSLLLTRFIVQKICAPLVVLIGIVGNSISIFVLTRKCMKSSTNSYLTALAVFDLLFLVFSFSLSLKHHQNLEYSVSYVHWFPVARVFTDMFANVSVTLTVTFTVERYVGVCHPMKESELSFQQQNASADFQQPKCRILCTCQRAKVITAVVSSFAIVCTVPEFWEMKVVWKRVENQTVPVAVYTEFALWPSYEVGYYWFIVIMFTLLPLVLLCVFNGILISTVLTAAKLRKQMILLTPGSKLSKNVKCTKSHHKEQQKITKMLITVVLAFLVCQLPGALLLLFRTYHSLASVHLSQDEENNIKIAGNVTNLLIQVNASVNFILYSAISTKFRRVLYSIICRGRRYGWELQDRHHTVFSKTDRGQTSSIYGDRPASKVTPFSSYTFHVKMSLRSSESDRMKSAQMISLKDLSNQNGARSSEESLRFELIQEHSLQN